MTNRLTSTDSLDKSTRLLGTVFGLHSEKGEISRYTWVVDSAPTSFEEPKEKGDEGSAVAPPIKPIIDDDVRRQLAAGADFVRVIITLQDRFTTRLDDTDMTKYAVFAEPSTAVGPQKRGSREAKIATRKAEADSLQAGVKSWLGANGIPGSDIGSFWATNALAARLPANLIIALATNPTIRRISLDHALTDTGTTTWDGENFKIANGLNASFYIDNGYDGSRVNPATGFPISIGVLDFFFADDHPVFQHSPGWSKIVGDFNCKSGSCTGGLPAPGPTDDVHGSWAASAAAAAARNGQISGSAAFQLDRTGVAEQTELTFVSTGYISDTINGLQAAVNWDADIITESFGGGNQGTSCDGSDAGWETAVYSAYQAGVLTVGSAGNDSHPPNACELTGLSEAPSQFVVGALDDPGTGSYPAVGLASYSSGGGVDITVSTLSFPRGFTAVDAVVPGRWAFAAGKSGSFDDVSGTSFAAPQVAGVAAVFKDWMLGLGFSQANTPGVLFTNLLAMTDRTGSGGTQSSRFDANWGGGRLQARYFEQPDHPSGLWHWETAVYTLTNHAHVQHLVAGAGNEPSGINTFKVYAVFFEQDGSDVADVDVNVYDHGCGTGAALLGNDTSRDMKSMVSIGSAGSGKDVCVDLYGWYVPTGQTRDVVLVTYYTDETSMR